MSIGISLGHNCFSASYGAHIGIRGRKADGYKTCPFDEMNSTYHGIVECLRDDFKYFTDSRYLSLITHPTTCRYYPGETLLYNTKYGFLFNHESPGHANLYQTQNWKGGVNHYINNDFEMFRERYERRIDNFRSYIRSGRHITFLITCPNENLHELREVIDTWKISYEITRFDIQNQDSYTYHLDLLQNSIVG